MSGTLLKTINIDDPGTPFRYGGNDLDTINRLLSGEDLGYLLKMQNIFYFGGAQKLRVLRPNGTNWVSFNSEAETADRAILIPALTADQRMAFEGMTQPLTNKILDYPNNTHLRHARIGAYSPAGSKGAFNDCYGALRGMVGIGNQSTATLNTGGKYHVWNTVGTVIDDCAGVVKLDSFTSWRLANPLIRFATLFNPNTSNNRRLFKGFGPQRLLTLNSDTQPITTTESGVIFGHGAADNQFYVWHNDGDGGAVQKTPFPGGGIPLPTANTNYIVEISANDTVPSFTITLYSVITPGVRGSVIGSLTITTDIPSQTAGLYTQDLVVGAVAASPVRSNNIHYIEVFTS